MGVPRDLGDREQIRCESALVAATEEHPLKVADNINPTMTDTADNIINEHISNGQERRASAGANPGSAHTVACRGRNS